MSLAKQASFDLRQKVECFDGEITVLHEPRNVWERHPLGVTFANVSDRADRTVSHMLDPMPYTAEEEPRPYLIDHAAKAWIHPDEVSYFESLQADANAKGQVYTLPDDYTVDVACGIVTRLWADLDSKWTVGDRVISTVGPFVPATKDGVPWFVEITEEGGDLGEWRPPVDVKPLVRTASRAIPPPTFSSVKRDSPSLCTEAPCPSTPAHCEVSPPPHHAHDLSAFESHTRSLDINGKEYSIYRIAGNRWGLSRHGLSTPPDSDAESEAGDDRTATSSKDNTRKSWLQIQKTAEENQRSLNALNEQVSRLSKAVWTHTSRQGTEGKMWRDTGLIVPSYISVGA